jgi:putative transposase
MRQYAGNARKIWNLALNRQQELHTAGEKFTNSFGMNNWLPSWKQEFSYLCDSPSQTPQQVTKDLAAAYKNFFEKRADFPQFKKKGRSSDSFRFPQGFEIDEANRRIRLPKLGWIHYRKSHGILGLAKNITVSCVAGKWYASIQTWAANTSINVDSRPRCWHHAIRDAL